jgi:hypothetical protein
MTIKKISALVSSIMLGFFSLGSYADITPSTSCQTLQLQVINNSGHPLTFTGFNGSPDVNAHFESSVAKEGYIGAISATVTSNRDNLGLTAYFKDDQSNTITLNIFDPDQIYVSSPLFVISKMQNYSSASSILIPGQLEPQCQRVASAVVTIK